MLYAERAFFSASRSAGVGRRLTARTGYLAGVLLDDGVEAGALLGAGVEELPLLSVLLPPSDLLAASVLPPISDVLPRPLFAESPLSDEALDTGFLLP